MIFLTNVPLLKFQGDRESADEQDIFTPTVCVSKNLKTSKVAHVSAGSNHSLCIVTQKENSTK